MKIYDDIKMFFQMQPIYFRHNKTFLKKWRVPIHKRYVYINYSFIDLPSIRIIISIGPGHCGHVQDFGFDIAFRWSVTTACDCFTFKITETKCFSMRIFWLIDFDVLFTIITKKKLLKKLWFLLWFKILTCDRLHLDQWN